MKKDKKSQTYINQDIINGFSKKKDDYDYKKLVGLLTELNSNYALENPYSSMMLIRAVIDHIPPLLGHDTFEKVANNYSWTKNDKKYMESLLDFKNEAHDALHTQISGDQDFLDMESIPKKNRINRLLQECVKIGGTIKLAPLSKTKQSSKHNNIKVKLIKETVRWAKFSTSKGVWPSFQVNLEIDNYSSNKPDYISVAIIANLTNGNRWIGNHFIFGKDGGQDEEFWIDKIQVKKPLVFVSNHPAGGSRSEPMPDISDDPIEVHIKTRSGPEFKIPVLRDHILKK